MRRTSFLITSLLVMNLGLPSHAEPPETSSPPQPRASRATAGPEDAAAPRRRFLGRFRSPQPTAPQSQPTRADAPAARGPSVSDSRRPVPDGSVRRVQAEPGDMRMPVAPPAVPALPETSPAVDPTPTAGVQSITLQTALYGAITGNPDLVALRQGNPAAASAEAVEVARHFPTALNPTLWIDYRPISLIPPDTFGGANSGKTPTNRGYYHNGGQYVYLSLRQPIELGHQNSHRYQIAKSAYEQQRWNVVQAEITTLVQTYRFFQTAAYQREKTRVSQDLADFNDRLLDSLKRRLEANQAPAADVALARVESRATRQLAKAARQAYLTALTDLRNQIGIPATAGTVEPLGEFTLPKYIPPVDEQVMIQTALANRPDIHAARAQVAVACSTTRLAKADRIPTPVVGPEWEVDEVGVQYVGLVLISPLPIFNNGSPLVHQREAEHRRANVALQQVQQRAISQVRAGVAKWNGARELLEDSSGLLEELSKEVAVLERLFEAGQSDLTKLMQARQRLIQLENAGLDAVWQATQAQADLLLAIGAPAMINGMLEPAQRDDAASPTPTSQPPVKPTTQPGPPAR